MDLVRILDRHHMLALHARVTKLGDRRRRIRQQTLTIGRVAPGTGDNARPVLRANVIGERIDERIHRGRVDKTFPHKKCLERLGTQRRF